MIVRLLWKNISNIEEIRKNGFDFSKDYFVDNLLDNGSISIKIYDGAGIPHIHLFEKSQYIEVIEEINIELKKGTSIFQHIYQGNDLDEAMCWYKILCEKYRSKTYIPITNTDFKLRITDILRKEEPKIDGFGMEYVITVRGELI